MLIPLSHSNQGPPPTVRHPPYNIYFVKESADEFIAEAMHLSAASLVEAGIQAGRDLMMNAAPYVNYASFETPPEACGKYSIWSGFVKIKKSMVLRTLWELQADVNPKPIQGPSFR